MAQGSSGALGILKQTASEFSEDECPRLAAALAYYTVFSLPPLLVLIITIAGLVLDPAQIEGQIESQIGTLLGPDAADQVKTMIQNASTRMSQGGLVGTILGALALIFGATGAFGELQQGLNRAWEVAPDPEHSGVKTFLVKRLFSFTMILGIAFLLLVSLVLSTAMAAIGGVAADMVPGGVSTVLLWVLNGAVQLVVITLLFAAMFKILPDAEIAWRDVWVGAGVTALLFVAGKFAIGLYLGNSNPGSAFGAAGSLALILVWIYYSSMIFYAGAEFTQIWARRHGKEIRPSEGAVRIVDGIPENPEARRDAADRDAADRAAARRATAAATRVHPRDPAAGRDLS